MSDTRSRFVGLQRVPVTDETELQDALQLQGRLDDLEALVRAYERVAKVRPKPRGELGNDDVRTSFLQLSHYVSASMTMATDCLLGVDQLLRPDGENLEHRLTAQFPLLRSALECAATALWLLRPDSQRDRILRLLRLRVSDAQYDVQFTKSFTTVVEGLDRGDRSGTQHVVRAAARRKKKHLQRIREIAHAESIAPEEYEKGAPGNEEIIRQAANDQGMAASTWRLISGLTHPSPLRNLQTSRGESKADYDDGTSLMFSSTDVGITHLALITSMLLYRQATEFRRFRTLRPVPGS